jgi:secreted trypsin-like serine protease
MLSYNSGNFYVKLEENSSERKKYHHFGDLFSKLPGFEHVNSYVTSAGTCNGDSGGPAYIKEGNKFIVIGESTSLQWIYIFFF